MISPISLALFDAIDDFARDVRGGDPKPLAAVTVGVEIIVFCESFFDQLFANVLNCQIQGFNPQSQNSASRLAEELKRDPNSSAPLRSLIGLFENFCEVYSQLISGSYAEGEITYRQFHELYVSRLLERAKAWAEKSDLPDLADRIDSALEVYDNAILAMKW